MVKVNKVSFENGILTLERSTDIYTISLADKVVTYFATFKEDEEKLDFGFSGHDRWGFKFATKELRDEVLKIVKESLEDT